MEPLLVASLLLSFFITLFFIPIWIRKTKDAGLVGKDMHKPDKKEVSEAGGVPVLFGFIFGVLIYVAIKTFYFKTTGNIIEIFSLLTSLLIISFVGLIDDILGWKIGLTKKMRIIFVIFAAVPLIVINAGHSQIDGMTLGIIYPLLIIPLGIVGASTTFNFLAGYNGLETSQGILILSALAFVTWHTGNSWLSVIALCMVASLIAFYLFNRTPSKVFPGDVLTYSIGALIAIIAILGDIEKIAVFFFIPYILETILKIRGKCKKESFAKINGDGSLEMPYDKIYGVEHLAIYLLKKIKKNKKVYEKEVVYLINAFQILIIILGLLFVL
jgi:UDP-N-acetylglucosamine--dolichyl-phosphate N-acetylglucosaminephosphotransferase